MKFKWKLFLCMMTIITLAYSISGSLMITSTFRMTFDREVEMAKEEHEILQDTFIMMLSHLTQNVSEEVWRQVAMDIDATSARDQFYFWLESENENDIYLSNSMRSDKVPVYKMETESSHRGCYLYSDNERFFLMTRSFIISDSKDIYLNIVRDVTEIFNSRNNQLFLFYKIMLLNLILIAGFSYFIATHLTKPLSRLSSVAREISQGNLSSRAGFTSADEVGQLANDIDEMAENLENNIEQLNDAVRREEDFVGNFAHELKTPLTSIIGYADMLRSRKLDDETRFSFSNYIFTEGKRLEGMSFKLLDLIVTKKKSITLKKINANYFFDEVKTALLPLMEKEKVDFQVKNEEGFIMADLDLLKSVLFNLSDNARKASKGSSEPRVHINGKVENDCYMIEISDNGVGIPKEELDKITEAFYMVDKSRAREQGGAGLGLALCKQIVELHEGRMEFVSEIGKGTSIFIELKGGSADE